MPSRNPVQIVEEQLVALRALQKIARQPVALEVMRLVVQEHFGTNGHALQPAPNERAVERRGAIWDTGIKEAIKKVLSGLPSHFSYKEVIGALGKDGYQIAAKNARVAVGRVLQQLVNAGVIVVVYKGIAGNASLYRVA
jgi:hypothetical protein